jgi:monoamine oxidase
MPTPIDLLETLRDGLPGRHGEPRQVVIIGAGIAGLTAGMLLQEAGHTVTILEARNRLGGRIHTYRGFAALHATRFRSTRVAIVGSLCGESRWSVRHPTDWSLSVGPAARGSAVRA